MNNLMLLLLAHAVVVALLGPHLRWWVRSDVKRFNENGSRDSLGQTFHRQRLSWRIGVGVVLALAGSMPLWGHRPAFTCSVAALLLLIGAHWLRHFNPTLNVARKQDYIGQWHVSWSPNAAVFPDRYIWRKAWRALGATGPPPDRENRLVIAVAGPMLRRLLVAVWWAGIVGYAVLLGCAVVLL